MKISLVFKPVLKFVEFLYIRFIKSNKMGLDSKRHLENFAIEKLAELEGYFNGNALYRENEPVNEVFTNVRRETNKLFFKFYDWEMCLDYVVDAINGYATFHTYFIDSFYKDYEAYKPEHKSDLNIVKQMPITGGAFAFEKSETSIQKTKNLSGDVVNVPIEISLISDFNLQYSKKVYEVMGGRKF